MVHNWVRVTNDQVVSNAPVLIGGVVLTDDGAGNADVTLYDGSSSSDVPLMTVKSLQYSSKQLNFQPYLRTSRGLYVDVGDNVTELLVLLVYPE